jgi:hypothetical protein
MDLLKDLEQTRRQAGKPLGGKIQFRGQMTEIQRALAAGYSKREIWQLLHSRGDFAYSYSQFLSYARQLALEARS